jgi:hypothetical protein
MGMVFCMGLAGTLEMTSKTLNYRPHARSLAHHLRTPDWQELSGNLEALHGEPVLIATADTFASSWLNGWAAYFARHNQVWLANPQLNDVMLDHAPGAENILLPRSLPARLLVLESRVPGVQAFSPPLAATLAWSNGSYHLWETQDRNWAVPVQLANAGRISQLDGQPIFWIGLKETALTVMAGSPGTLTLRGTFRLGPGQSPGSSCVVRMGTNHGYRDVIVPRGTEESVSIPIPFGRSTILFTALDDGPPGFEYTRPEDQRSYLVSVQGLRVQFSPRKPGGPAHVKKCVNGSIHLPGFRHATDRNY